MLAKLFAQASNVLVLDEPTNDLDVETLDLLEELLADYQGTVLLVSHDREFINHVVTETLVFEGAGQIGEYVGGYDDWLSQRSDDPVQAPADASRQKTEPKKVQTRKLTNKERDDLKKLPRIIEALEAELEALNKKLNDPDFYRSSPDDIKAVTERAEAVPHELETAFDRWAELDALAT